LAPCAPSSAEFLKRLIEAVPYQIHTVLTDNGTHFTKPGNTASAAKAIQKALARGEIFRAHGLRARLRQGRYRHRLTKPNHPWTNGQVERMNRTLKEATIRRYHDESHEQLRQHLQAFRAAYNDAKRLKR